MSGVIGMGWEGLGWGIGVLGSRWRRRWGWRWRWRWRGNSKVVELNC